MLKLEVLVNNVTLKNGKMSLKNRLSPRSEVAEFISSLMFSRNQAHTFHLQTNSFAKHLALDTYYNEIIPLIDELVETYQGTHRIILHYTNDKRYLQGDDRIIPYFESILSLIEDTGIKIFTDSDLLNILDEIKSLIKSTLYKLKNLS